MELLELCHSLVPHLFPTKMILISKGVHLGWVSLLFFGGIGTFSFAVGLTSEGCLFLLATDITSSFGRGKGH